MAKKQIVELNWNNKSLVNAVHYLHYCEGRLSKEELIKQGTKTLFYQLKKGGYIKEVENSKDMFKATDKLKCQYVMYANPGATWGGPGSNIHSKGMVQAVSLLPERTLRDGSIKTEEILKKEFRDLKQTEYFKEALKKEQVYYKQQLEALDNQRKENMISEARYELNKASIEFKKDIVESDKPVSVTDLQVTLYKEELAGVRERMQEVLEKTTSIREQELWHRAVQRLVEIEQTVETVVEIGVEVVTSQYNERDIQTKYNYEKLCNKFVILVPAPE